MVANKRKQLKQDIAAYVKTRAKFLQFFQNILSMSLINAREL